LAEQDRVNARRPPGSTQICSAVGSVFLDEFPGPVVVGEADGAGPIARAHSIPAVGEEYAVLDVPPESDRSKSGATVESAEDLGTSMTSERPWKWAQAGLTVGADQLVRPGFQECVPIRFGHRSAGVVEEKAQRETLARADHRHPMTDWRS